MWIVLCYKKTPLVRMILAFYILKSCIFDLINYCNICIEKENSLKSQNKRVLSRDFMNIHKADRCGFDKCIQ